MALIDAPIYCGGKSKGVGTQIEGTRSGNLAQCWEYDYTKNVYVFSFHTHSTE